MAFSVEHASRLTGASERQLRYWDDTDVFRPSYADENRRRPFSRIYSFRDVVGLRTLSLLRNSYGVSLQELRKTGHWLRGHHETPWASLQFYVHRHRVYLQDPETEAIIAARPPHQATLVELEKIASDVASDARKLLRRTADQYGRVTKRRYVAHNAEVLAGTRIPTEAVWNFHEEGYDTDQILQQYPTLRPEDIEAAIQHERAKRQVLAS